MRCGDFDDSYADWVEQHINSGTVGWKLTAHDIMTPFSATLQESDLHEDYLAALCNSGVAVAPYFDAQGNYLGIVRASAWEEAHNNDFKSVLEVPSEVDEQAPRNELLEHFTDHGRELLVVMNKRQPVGYITNQEMASILAPVNV